MTLVATRPPSGAAQECLMFSASFGDSNDEDDESCIFPTTASLAASSVVGAGGSDNWKNAAAPSSPRRRPYNGPYLNDCIGGEVNGSFDSECASSVSTVTAVSSVMGSFGCVASNAEFASSAYPSSPRALSSPSRQRSVGFGSVPPSSVGSPLGINPETAADGKTKKKSKKGGRGRSAMKSLSRSLRSRSPGFRRRDGASEKGVAESAATEKHSSERRRSRTRSPLRAVANSIKKTTSRMKNQNSRSRSKSVGSSPGKDFVDVEAGRSAVRRLPSGTTVSVCPSDEMSVFSAGSMGSVDSHSTALSTAAASIASTPSRSSRGRSPRRRRSSGNSFRRVSSASSLLPQLARDDSRDESDSVASLGRIDTFDASQTKCEVIPEDERGETVAEGVDRWPALLQRAKSFRRSRSCDSKRQRGLEDTLARIECRIAEAKAQDCPCSPPEAVQSALAPVGLTGRMPTADIVSMLKAGSGAADAVRRLRECQAGLTATNPSVLSAVSRLSHEYIAGIPVPDYASYVAESVWSFSKVMGVSDAEFDALKDGLLGWAYYGNAV